MQESSSHINSEATYASSTKKGAEKVYSPSKKAVAGFAAGVMLSVGGLAGCSESVTAGNENSSSTATPSMTGAEMEAASKAETERISNSYELPSVESLRVPDNLTPNETADRLIDVLYNNWLSAGYAEADAIYQAQKNSNNPYGLGADSITQKVTDKYSSVYAEAIFGADWENNQNATTITTNLTKMGADDILYKLTKTHYTDTVKRTSDAKREGTHGDVSTLMFDVTEHYEYKENVKDISYPLLTLYIKPDPTTKSVVLLNILE